MRKNSKQIYINNIKRSAGIFLHPTSLPSKFGIGDFGESAYKWIDLLSSASQSHWQICPLGPTGYGESPYQSLCSFAGNILMISPEALLNDGLLTTDDLDKYPKSSGNNVDFEFVKKEKNKLFNIAFYRFSPDDDFNAFCNEQKWWLDDFVLFVIIKELNNGTPWYEWDKPLQKRNKTALKKIVKENAERIEYHKFLQYKFYSQWRQLRNYANEKNVNIIGDIPYYVSYDSSDVWVSPKLFELDKNFKRIRVGGVPPDYFSEDGQLWGNPLYNWKAMAEDDYLWWIRRIKATLDMVDIIRIDHFRAFDTYWAVDGNQETAREGEWIKGPGMKFFKALKKEIGELPLIAEDLGDITDDVRKLVEDTKMPGMKILQFAFDKNPNNLYLPYNMPKKCIVYTGTHDNNTSLGWYNEQPEDIKEYVRVYLGCDDGAFLDYFLRLAYSSVGDVCIVPMQDVLALDGAHRFNTPGTGEGNWSWHFNWEMLEEWMSDRIKMFTNIYGRA